MSSLAWGVVTNLLKIGSAPVPALIRSAEHNGGQNPRDDTVAPHPGQPKRYSISGLSHMDFSLVVLPIYRIPEATMQLHS